MAALLGLAFVLLALVRSVRARAHPTAMAMLVVGCGHASSAWSSVDAWTTSGNPVAVLGALVLGRSGLAHEGARLPAPVALIGAHPLLANAAFVMITALPFASVERRLQHLNPLTDEAQRLAALSQALLGVALVDALLLGCALLARALVAE